MRGGGGGHQSGRQFPSPQQCSWQEVWDSPRSWVNPVLPGMPQLERLLGDGYHGLGQDSPEG